ncbi:MAG: hypothetical protein VKK04_27330 [Synechococcales bacterium]|nr:hypothetical protein [Synechococcales bacterium]
MASSSPPWQHSLNADLVQQLKQPLTQPGVVSRRMADAIIERSHRLHNRLPLLAQQMERWSAVTDLETEQTPIVYVQPSDSINEAAQQGFAQQETSPDSPSLNIHPAPAPLPLIQAQRVSLKHSPTPDTTPPFVGPDSPALDELASGEIAPRNASPENTSPTHVPSVPSQVNANHQPVSPLALVKAVPQPKHIALPHSATPYPGIKEPAEPAGQTGTQPGFGPVVRIHAKQALSQQRSAIHVESSDRPLPISSIPTITTSGQVDPLSAPPIQRKFDSSGATAAQPSSGEVSPATLPLFLPQAEGDIASVPDQGTEPLNPSSPLPDSSLPVVSAIAPPKSESTPGNTSLDTLQQPPTTQANPITNSTTQVNQTGKANPTTQATLTTQADRAGKANPNTNPIVQIDPVSQTNLIQDISFVDRPASMPPLGSQLDSTPDPSTVTAISRIHPTADSPADLPLVNLSIPALDSQTEPSRVTRSVRIPESAPSAERSPVSTTPKKANQPLPIVQVSLEPSPPQFEPLTLSQVPMVQQGGVPAGEGLSTQSSSGTPNFAPSVAAHLQSSRGDRASTGQSATPSVPSYSQFSSNQINQTRAIAPTSSPSASQAPSHISSQAPNSGENASPENAPPPIDLDMLVEKVERKLMRRLVAESERRGKKQWH